MLKAMKSQLSLLSIEHGGRFAQDVRKRYGSSNVQWAISKSLDLIMIMPDLISKIRDLSSDPALSASDRRLNQYVLIYLYHPYDYVAEDKPGLFGYLDDAYLVGAVYSRFRRKIGGPVSTEDLTRDLEASLEVARIILPKETRKIDHMLEELSQSKSDAFEKLMRREKPKVR